MQEKLLRLLAGLMLAGFLASGVVACRTQPPPTPDEPQAEPAGSEGSGDSEDSDDSDDPDDSD